MADVEEEIFLRAIFFLLLVHKRRPLQAQNRLQNPRLRHRQIKFLTDLFQAVSLFVLFFFFIINLNCYGGRSTHIAQPPP